MSGPYDVIVIGGGPAGVAAAIQARDLDLSVLLVDEQDQAGGQVYRAPSPAIVSEDRTDGADLRRELAASRVGTLLGKRVWMVEPGFTVQLIGAPAVSGKALILATGAQERVAPVEGWTLPGVIGLAAATVLIKSQKVLPGAKVVVAGRGPLLLLVAALILEAGGKVAAVIDANPAHAWLSKIPALISRPDLMAQGAGWLARVVAAGTPIHFSSAVARMTGGEQVEAVEVLHGDGSVGVIACDAVCYGHGLAPATELSRQLGAAHVFLPDQGGWCVATDDDQRTDQSLLFACGDGAGVLGAAAAPWRGRIAALAAARDLGGLLPEIHADMTTPMRRALAKASRFGAAMTRLCPASIDRVSLAGPLTLICRCEGLTRTVLEAAIDAGARTPNALKAATRCGMGPCGGRFCADSAAAVIAEKTGRTLEQVGQMTGRSPIRPLPLSAVMGDFRYEDIPFPEPAPL